jgi:4-hydroxythreonine-4-phosphate dehydrogenase
VAGGEPAGIGPDIVCGLALQSVPARLAALADPDVLGRRAEALGLELAIRCIATPAHAEPHRAGELQVLPVRFAAAVTPGRPDPANAKGVIETLERATAACLRDEADALVTAPVQKSTISAGGFAFSGHTEYLAKLTRTEHVVMLLASPRLRVALATTHLPLRRVAGALTREGLRATLRILDADLRWRFGVEAPRILVLGLNPHAGEDGLLGDEEQTTIRPVVAALRREGLSLIGPVSADSAFTRESLSACDVVLAMYHDQGLPALKAQDFGEIVNVTLGLPIIRTSVDHGTALALAGTGKASPASLRAAVDLAIALAARRA